MNDKQYDKKEKNGVVRNYISGTIRAAVTALLVLLQFAIIIILAVFLTDQQLIIYYTLQIICTFIIAGLVNKKGSPQFKIAWLTIIAILPAIGLIMYVMWGRESGSKRLRRDTLRKIEYGHQFIDNSDEAFAPFEKLFGKRMRLARYMDECHFPLLPNNRVTYYPIGDDTFEAIIKDMEAATKFIFISFFIVGDGILWERIHEIMKRKAAEGVRVLLMYDDFGSMFRTDKTFKSKLEAEGIEVSIFNPIHKYVNRLYMNYRNHQKIVVIDGNIGYTGGMNLADEYVNAVERFGVWKDSGVRIEGEGVWGLTLTFLGMWGAGDDKKLMDYNQFRPTAVFSANDSFVQIIADGPANNPDNPIESVYRQFICGAEKYLYIMTPYLILEDSMTDALVEAAKSGVDVRVVTPYIPDKRMVKLLTEYNYGELLKNGIKVYEFLPGFIHSKTIVTDECAIVGTINMDFRSFYLHYECGAFLWDREATASVKEDFMKTIEICREITYEEWKTRPVYVKLAQYFLSLFSTLV